MPKLHVSLSLLVQPCQPLDGLSFSSNQPLILNPKKSQKINVFPQSKSWHDFCLSFSTFLQKAVSAPKTKKSEKVQLPRNFGKVYLPKEYAAPIEFG
jgi:hypothetical protein